MHDLYHYLIDMGYTVTLSAEDNYIIINATSEAMIALRNGINFNTELKREVQCVLLGICKFRMEYCK